MRLVKTRGASGQSPEPIKLELDLVEAELGVVISSYFQVAPETLEEKLGV